MSGVHDYGIASTAIRNADKAPNMKTRASFSSRAAVLVWIVCVGSAFGQDSFEAAIGDGRMKLVGTTATTTLTNRKLGSAIVRESSRSGEVTLRVGGTNVMLPVVVCATNYVYKGTYLGNTNYSLEIVEFSIRSTNDTPFNWCCCALSSGYARDFALFTTTNGTYATFVDREGVNVLLVGSVVTSDAARRLFLEDERAGFRPVERLLRTGVLMDAGRYFGNYAVLFVMSVDAVAVVGGELRVTLHGEQATPQFTYVLRNGDWALLKE
jgi:hypothetical protein